MTILGILVARVALASILGFSESHSVAILGFQVDLVGIAAMGTLVAGIIGGWFTFIKDRGKAVSDRDLELIRMSGERQEAEIARLQERCEELERRAVEDGREIRQLRHRVEELERENYALRGH